MRDGVVKIRVRDELIKIRVRDGHIIPCPSFAGCEKKKNFSMHYCVMKNSNQPLTSHVCLAYKYSRLWRLKITRL